MKTTTALLIAMGLASHAAWAQLQAPYPGRHAMPPPGSAMPPRAEPPSSSGMSGSSESGASGTHSDWQSSGPSNGMHSEAGTEFSAAPAEIPRLREQTQNDVTYLCGGVGQEEASYMKQQARNYDLMLTFATRTGDYLADVDVSIRNAKGDSVLQANCDGPMLLVDLPKSGTYRIRAETSGYSLNRTAKVAVSRNHAQRVARVAMVWPTAAAESGTAAISSGGSDTGGVRDEHRDHSDSDWRDERDPGRHMHPRGGIQ